MPDVLSNLIDLNQIKRPLELNQNALIGSKGCHGLHRLAPPTKCTLDVGHAEKRRG
uniref:Uncharacterized protein n=1 Tax=Anguilla anguilla TaxID=7936 RepID=A0A0E9ST52_ANGAN